MVVEDPRQSPEGLSTLSAITLAAMGNSVWPILRMATVLNTSSPSSPSSCQPPTGRRCSGARRRMREGATWRHLRCALQKRARLWHTHRPLCRRCVEMRLAQDALNAARAKLAQQHAAYVPAAVHAKPSFAVNEAMCFAPPALRCAAGAQSAGVRTNDGTGDVCRFVTISVISPRKRVGWLERLRLVFGRLWSLWPTSPERGSRHPDAKRAYRTCRWERCRSGEHF